MQGEAHLHDDSDLDDLISLGDVDDHPVVVSQNRDPGQQDLCKQYENGGLSIRGRGHVKQRALRSDWTDEAGVADQRNGALAIRGLSQSKGVQGSPNLLQRLSVRPAPNSTVQGGYRSAKVGNDLRHKLMARLEEEKSRSTSQANGNGTTKEMAQTHDTPTNGLPAASDVLQPDAAQRRMADLRARLLAERKNQKDVSPAAVTPVDRMAALKAKLKAEKEIRLAQEGA